MIPTHKPTYKTAIKLTLRGANETLSQKVAVVAENSPPQSLVIGEFNLGNENPRLTVSFCNELASRFGCFATFTEFQKVFQTSITAPKPLDPNDQAFDPPKQITGTTERRIARAYLYRKALHAHKTDLLRHDKKLALRARVFSNYRGDRNGYLAYIVDTFQMAFGSNLERFFFTPKSLNLSLEARRRHTFITGGTGSGKSNTLKHIIRHDLQQSAGNPSSVVVLDPHGQLAKEVARMEENIINDRLVYIAPHLVRDRYITINPFEVRDTSISTLEVQSAQLISALEMIVAGFSLNMESLLTPIVTVLLHRPNSDFSDLVRFMDDDRNDDLVGYGVSKLPYDEHREFFATQFHSQNYKSTKDALRNRFQALLNVPTIKRFLCGKSTLNLEDAIDDGKVIIFNFSASKTAKGATRALGQFMTALIQGYAIRRDEIRGNPKTPIFLYADECQYFCSPAVEEILGESRKYGLHLTLATQRTKQVGDVILDAIFGNVGTFIAGRNKGKTLALMAKELNVEAEEIRELKIGQFCVSSLEGEPVFVRVPEVRAKDVNMSQEEWANTLINQIDSYYSPVGISPQNCPLEDAQEIAQEVRQRKQDQPQKKPTMTPTAPTVPLGKALDQTHATIEIWRKSLNRRRQTNKPEFEPEKK